jgi:hypothetical protein
MFGEACRIEADIITTSRTINYDLTLGDISSFTDAFASVVNTEVIAAGSHGTDTQEAGYASLNTGISFFATGGVSITPTNAPAGQSDITTMITVTGAGTYGFKEPVPVYSGKLSALDYFPSPLARFPYNGSNVLEIFSPSNGLLDPGGTWITNISIPGDWSQASDGDVPHTHFLYDLDPLWNITSDFVYDPALNRTLFSVENDNYPGVDSYDNGPYPVVLLVGSQAPEPASVGMLTVGMIGLAYSVWRKRWTQPR